MTTPRSRPPAAARPVDLAVVKTASLAHAAPGDQVTYTFEGDQRRTGTAHNVVVTDIIRGGTTFVSASPCLRQQRRHRDLPAGDVTAGDDPTVTITVKMDVLPGAVSGPGPSARRDEGRGQRRSSSRDPGRPRPSARQWATSPRTERPSRTLRRPGHRHLRRCDGPAGLRPPRTARGGSAPSATSTTGQLRAKVDVV